jgi:hypothetical protein
MFGVALAGFLSTRLATLAAALLAVPALAVCPCRAARFTCRIFATT